MDKRKEFQLIQFSLAKFRIGALLLFLLAICFLIRLTPMRDILIVNYVTYFVLENSVSIIVIASLLIAINFVDLKRYQEKLAQEENENVS